MKRLSFVVPGQSVSLDLKHPRCYLTEIPIFSNRICTLFFEPPDYSIPDALWKGLTNPTTSFTLGQHHTIVEQEPSCRFDPMKLQEFNDQVLTPPLTPKPSLSSIAFLNSAEPGDSVIQRPFIPSAAIPIPSPRDETECTRSMEIKTKLARAFIGENLEVLVGIRKITNASILCRKSEPVSGKAMTRIVVSGTKANVENATKLLLELVQN